MATGTTAMSSTAAPTLPPAVLAGVTRLTRPILDTKGWGKHRSIGSNGERCFGQAVVEAAAEKGVDQNVAYDQIQKRVGVLLGIPYPSIPGWNDMTSTRRRDVDNLIDRLIASFEEEIG